MSDAVDIQTNGKIRVPWGVIVTVLWGLLLGLSTWTAQRELSRSDDRISALELRDDERSNQVTVLQTLRPEDKAAIQALSESQRRLEMDTAILKMNVARIMAKLGVEEVR